MDPSDSSSSRSGPSPGRFAYQTRLLERTSSQRSTSSLSRSTSQTNRSLLAPNTTGPALIPASTRRRTPSHRGGGSLDIVRDKWEERAKTEEKLEGRSDGAQSDDMPASTLYRKASDYQSGMSRYTDVNQTPSPLLSKRYSLPAIIASPPAPNTTGIAVVAPGDYSASPTSPNRMHLHSPPSTLSTFSSVSSVKEPDYTAVASAPATSRFPMLSRDRRSSVEERILPNADDSSSNSELSLTSTRNSYTPPSLTPAGKRPASVHDNAILPLQDNIGRNQAPSNMQLYSRARSVSPDKRIDIERFSTPPQSSLSAMSPKPFKSSYMANKKPHYGDNFTPGRSLGRHLPRIASGDANDDWEAEEPKEETWSSVEDESQQQQQTRDGQSLMRRAAIRNKSVEAETRSSMEDGRQIPQQARNVQSLMRRDSSSSAVIPNISTSGLVNPSVPNAEDVAGIPGRLRLSRNRAPSSPMPSPSVRLTRGLWADTQRHLLQAYEYLCHVGEAQQWIEGCLEEELGFGVVEMEEELRNGIVLAKLVRKFRGPKVVRRIYEAPKLDFRHSDNINYFFVFVREIGLPEGFIFELTDLYEKKNFPKVVYCIHALSHLLARRGLAGRIGNLLGRLQFSDDQLQKTQKGLKDAGVPMPNFNDVGRELAKEINEDPEEEPENEDERRDRLLLENESSIIASQAIARAFLVRKAQATLYARLRLFERYIPRFQTLCRGFLTRASLNRLRNKQADLKPWTVALQAASRAFLTRRAWYLQIKRVRAAARYVVLVQSHARGVLQRRRFNKLKAALRSGSISIVKLQSVARARVVRKSHRELAKSFARRDVMKSIIGIQTAARGVLSRRVILRIRIALQRCEPTTVKLQAQARGVLFRRRIGTQLAKIDDNVNVYVRIQAAALAYLARKRLLGLIRGLRRVTPAVVGIQARARANLAKQKHKVMGKALSEVKVVSSVNSFQARARAALTRGRHREQNKRLEFVEPDVIGFQAAARGALARRDYYAWRNHLWNSQDIATLLQALLRGATERKKFQAKMQYYRDNLSQVINIQALFRAKETREQYRQLTLGTNVSVGTIKNFVHLLDDSEADFREEMAVEGLRKKVVQQIRENQTLENVVNELDTKIALVVNNAKTFEELLRAKRSMGGNIAAINAARASILAAHGDPFAGPSTLDYSAKRKLELYQQLFYLLQTKGEYLSKLFMRVSAQNVEEKRRRLVEHVVLTLFCYGQDRREDYLLLKLFQNTIHEEIAAAKSIAEVRQGHPMYINIAVQYIRPKQVFYIQETLQQIILDIVGSDDLDLEVDPALIYRARVSLEEMRSGVAQPNKDIAFHQALKDPDTRAEYIRHLQVLQWWTETFVTAITQSTPRIPYGIRFLARETLAALREKFPNESEESYTSCIGRLIYYRSINPAIITPETFDVVPSTIDVESRKNLAQISRLLTQICSGLEFGEEIPCFVPVNDYVRKAIGQMSSWLVEVANVPDAETQYHAHEFLDATVQAKPIDITPNEVYSMHSILSQHLDDLAPSRDDPLRVILNELNGVPTVGNNELTDARDHPISLQLTNRFANVRDPQADEKTLWVQGKRTVLAILRVQPAKDLVESLMQPVTDSNEVAWGGILEEMEIEQLRQNRRMPSTIAADSAYHLDDIRSMSFREVKAQAIFFLLELEKHGRITRDDGYQGILNAIASDVRSKHRKRIDRQQEKEYMKAALKHLSERKKYFEEQINSYNNYVEGAMNTMQRGNQKKRFALPFTKQFNHMRDLQRAGKIPQFGSFIYSARLWYDKGILLSLDKYSPLQYDKMDVVLSSNSVGIFTVEIRNHAMGISNRIAMADVKMEDLLQAQYEDRASLSLFDGMAKFNLKLLLYQINKKFYV